MDGRHTDMFMFVLSILMAVFLVRTEANPPYTYTEGTYNAGDQVFANCTFDIKGKTNKRREGDLPLTAETSGAKITYVNILNNKPSGQQGTIAKKEGGGGIGESYIVFHLVSVKSHGFLFHIELRGTTPPGTTEPPLIGNCNIKF